MRSKIMDSLAVLVVFAGLSFFVVPCGHPPTTKAKEAVLRDELKAMRTALAAYREEHGGFPNRLDVLVGHGYLKRMPIDPFTLDSTSWVPVFEQATDGSRRVVDVRSGSEASALHGTAYNTW
jgi:general secretion pathway protein G